MMIRYFTIIKYGLPLIITLLLNFQSNAQLTAGDIMFVGYNADGNDGFSVVALVDIPANTIIYFTDNEWNGLGIGEGGEFVNEDEWELTWDTGTILISAGIVVTFNETSLESNAGYGVTRGSIIGNIKLTEHDEVLYTFQGVDNLTPTVFISAIASDEFNDTNGTLTKTDLTAGTNAISISGDKDVMIYAGSTECDLAIPSDCAIIIADPNNWATEDGEFDQSKNGLFPDFPSDVPISFGETPLPITLMSFDVTVHEESINIAWKTASETNNDFFTIERSKDGFDWKDIITINGAGNSSSTLYYSATDKDPNIGISYYRLKQTDFDGQYSYSKTRSVIFNISEINNINIYPNPTNHQITMEGEEIKNFKIYNLLHQDISDLVKVTRKSNQRYIIDLSNLPQGLYIIKTKTTFSKIFKR